MTKPAHAHEDDYDILGGDAEDVVDALPIPSGQHEIVDDVLGAEDDIVEHRPVLNFGGDLLDAVDEWDFGDEIPASSTEVYGEDAPPVEDGLEPGPVSGDFGIPIPPVEPPDPTIIENRPVLNYGGDIPDAVEEQWDFGDEIPAASTEVYGDDDVGDGLEPDDILSGAAVDTHDPAVRGYLEKQIAAAAPLVNKDLFKGRNVKEWDLSFGPAWAPAGRRTTITETPQCLFRAEKIMATDSGSTPGLGTRIIQVAVGQKIQKPGGVNGTLTQFFSESALANGIRFDTAQAWSAIAVTVSFVEACTFNLSVFGKAILEP